MPIIGASTKLLWELMSQCEERLAYYGCIDVDDSRMPESRHTLRNEIHPMFTSDRWLTGYKQVTPIIYKRLKLPLRLASLFLQEDCVLDHFVHFQVGQRKRNVGGEEYIVEKMPRYSNAQRRRVERQFFELARFVTCSFCPKSLTKEVARIIALSHGSKSEFFYGVSFFKREQAPISKHYRRHEWPRVEPRPPDFQDPLILMNADFWEFLNSPTYSDTDLPRYYRTMFVFACTLVHEVAHVFNWFVNGYVKEIRWGNLDLAPELGFAWERAIFGMILQPLFNDLNYCPLLTSVGDSKAYIGAAQMKKAVIAVVGFDHPYYAELYRVADNAPWDELLRPEDFWNFPYNIEQHERCVAAIRAIPMKWITDWFVEERWECRRRRWARTGTYEPPALGETFLLLYKHDHQGAGVWYPLDPAFPQDQDPIRGQQEWMATYPLPWSE